jgi:hypothetical protein
MSSVWHAADCFRAAGGRGRALPEMYKGDTRPHAAGESWISDALPRVPTHGARPLRGTHPTACCRTTSCIPIHYGQQAGYTRFCADHATQRPGSISPT